MTTVNAEITDGVIYIQSISHIGSKANLSHISLISEIKQKTVLEHILFVIDRHQKHINKYCLTTK